jgi:hypothetical protein
MCRCGSARHRTRRYFDMLELLKRSRASCSDRTAAACRRKRSLRQAVRDAAATRRSGFELVEGGYNLSPARNREASWRASRPVLATALRLRSAIYRQVVRRIRRNRLQR